MSGSFFAFWLYVYAVYVKAISGVAPCMRLSICCMALEYTAT